VSFLSKEDSHLLWIQDIVDRLRSSESKPDGEDLNILTTEFALFNASQKKEIFLYLLGRVTNYSRDNQNGNI
jgi:hypothetical protein